MLNDVLERHSHKQVVHFINKEIKDVDIKILLCIMSS